MNCGEGQFHEICTQSNLRGFSWGATPNFPPIEGGFVRINHFYSQNLCFSDDFRVDRSQLICSKSLNVRSEIWRQSLLFQLNSKGINRINYRKG